MKTSRLYICLDCHHQFRHMDENQRRCPVCASGNSVWRREFQRLAYEERVRSYNRANGIAGRFEDE